MDLQASKEHPGCHPGPVGFHQLTQGHAPSRCRKTGTAGSSETRRALDAGACGIPDTEPFLPELHKPAARRVLAVLSILTLAVLQWRLPLDLALAHASLVHLYYLPVVWAALYDGWKGGLAAGAACGALQWLALPAADSSRSLLAAALYSIAGVCAGLLSMRLRTGYSHLQSNFEAMKRAERLSALGQLSAGLAHEIRNPLASIAGAASILTRVPGLDDKALRCVSIIDQESRRLDGLLTTFLNFARPRPVALRMTDIEPLFENILHLAAHRLRRRDLHFVKTVQPGFPGVYCDPELLSQVLLNLMINAIEASPDQATITLAAAFDRTSVWIDVADEGSGVAPEDVDKLFDPFFTTKEEGTGLGLPVAHQVVSQMGGTLTARHNPTAGMTFTVTLPLRKE